MAQIEKTPHHQNLSDALKRRIFGQDHIIDTVVDVINIHLAGLGDENRPVATFLFSGPTGTGKTELAKELAVKLDRELVRFDMSEYADEYSVRNLIGSQKGLVGYDEGGLLTNAVQKKPDCVLLLDEIEKAHQTIYNTFLQVFDYGTLTDSKGDKIDFTDTIIIMTSNLGTNEERGIGFGNNTTIHREAAIANFLSPEFRNRIDKMMEFRKITSEVTFNILEKYLDTFRQKLYRLGISLSVTDAAKTLLTAIGFESEMGARSIYRMIDTEFKKHISKEILLGNLAKGGEVHIDVAEDGFKYSYIGAKESTDCISERGSFEYDFETSTEAISFARENPGVVIVRSPSGFGYIVKDPYS